MGGISEWHTFVVALLGALTTGFIYAYSTYANALQAQFNLSQSAKDTIGIAPVLCNLITFTNGLIMDRTSVPFCVVLGGIIMMTSYGLFGLAALNPATLQTFPKFHVGSWHIDLGSPVFVFFMLGAAGNYGASFLVAATFTVLSKNFHEARPAVVCIAKSWVGVATGVGTALFCGFFPSEDTAPERLYFLFFVAGINGLVPILISPILRPLATERLSLPDNLLVPQSWRLMIGYILSAVLIITTLASTFFKGSVLFSVVLTVLLVVPFVIIVPACFQKATVVRATEQEVSPLAIASIPFAMQSQSPVPDRPPQSGSQGSVFSAAIALGASPWASGPWDMIKRPEFIMLWLCTLFLQSGGIFLTTNISSMVQTRSGAAVTAASAVTIFSCLQAFARLVTGNTSTMLLRAGLPRTAYFPVLMLVMAAGHAVLCVSGPVAMYLGTGLCGVAFGSVYPLLVLSVAEVFGKERIASNYMIFDGTPGAIGSLIFAKFLAQSVFSAHEDADGKCHGDDCFRLAHVVMVAASLVGFLVAALFAWRTAPVYKELLENRVS